MHRAALVATFALLFATGCDKGATDPSRVVPLVGVLERAGATVSTLDMRHTGNLRVTAVSLQAVAADGTRTQAAGVTFSIGDGNATVCTATGNFALAQGDTVSLGLAKGGYCIKLTEPTAVPEGSTLAYEMRLDIID
jgi:hypothetical protein